MKIDIKCSQNKVGQKYINCNTELLNMNTKEIVKRYILFIVSLFFSALGVAVTKHGELGVSPISSVANVMSCKYEAVSLGTWLVIWNCILILGQVVILKKSFRPIQLLQLPLSLLFGIFTDIGMIFADYISVPNYFVRISLVVCGTVILAFGIALSVIANVVMNSGEAFVKAVSDKSGMKFGNVKIGFDICCVVLSVALLLMFFGGSIVGTREGTILTALFTGVAVKIFIKIFESPLEKILTQEE